MFRFIHSADWQLGARFSQFGSKGSILREARLNTLRRALDIARQRAVDAFIVAGDLFEDNQVDEVLVTAVLQLFTEYPSVPIYLLPGNHDPISGPESVWMRRPFANAPNHVHVLKQPETIDLGGAFLVASPLQQKISTIDPSLKLVELAMKVPEDSVRIGVTHGALAIEGKHQPNDFPIALDAASRAGLDYLAIGHWHNWFDDMDGGRIVMPGTPEPDSFDHERCGFVALVEIDGRGAAPRVEAVPVASLTWRELSFDLLSAEASRTTLLQTLSAVASDAVKTVVRVVIKGTAPPQVIAETRGLLDQLLAPFLVGQVADRSSIALSDGELLDLQMRHPVLAQVLSDIDRLETLATGQAPAATTSTTSPLTLTDAQTLLSSAKIDLTALTAEQCTQIRQLLLQTMQEAAS